MEPTAKAAEILNDLIEINNDRIAGFQKAITDIQDENIDLKKLFQGYTEQSRKNVQELAVLAGAYGDVETGTSTSGTLHRAWIDVKSIFGVSDRESILSEAERGEDAIKKAYQESVSNGELPSAAVVTVSAQAHEINVAHDQIKALRDTSNR